MQSLLNLRSSSGLPLCLSGITHPLTFSKEMADHDRRREAMKKHKSQGREVSRADQEMGMQRNLGEIREGEVEHEDLESLLNLFSQFYLKLPSPAKAA